jgi:hypothetical protein
MRKRTIKKGKLVVSANSNEAVKFYDKKPIKKEDVLSPPNLNLQTKKSL